MDHGDNAKLEQKNTEYKVKNVKNPMPIMGFHCMQICTIHFFDDMSVLLVKQFQFSEPELIIPFLNEPPLTFAI